MTLTVRLDGPLDSALTRYCKETGVSKSLVVQESLAAYLLKAGQTNPTAVAPSSSANHRAFADAGLIGAVSGGQGADKAAVRQRIQAAAGRARPTPSKRPA